VTKIEIVWLREVGQRIPHSTELRIIVVYLFMLIILFLLLFFNVALIKSNKFTYIISDLSKLFAGAVGKIWLCGSEITSVGVHSTGP
jgi:hypothetical protein